MKTTFLLFASLFVATTSSAQTRDSLSLDTTHVVSPKINKRKLTAIIAAESAFYVGGISYLGFIWYKDEPRVPFEFYNDSKGYLQVDKFGHAFGSYFESYVGYHALINAGVPKKKALIYGGMLGLMLQTPIEILDGMYEGWGFSWGDMAANAAGSGFVIGQELLFKEQVVKYKFSYANSIYAPQANGYLGSTVLGRVFQDYNGHTFWLSMGLHRLFPASNIPKWLNVSVGYGANGMFGEFENIKRYRGVAIPETERYRQYLLSLDVDWTKIKTKNRFLQKVFKSMFMVKLPFPALEFNSKGQLRVYGIYY